MAHVVMAYIVMAYIKVCPELTETASCNNAPCPVDCKVAYWGPI